MKRERAPGRQKGTAQPLNVRLNDDNFIVSVVSERRISEIKSEIEMRYQGRIITVTRDKKKGVLTAEQSENVSSEMLIAIDKAIVTRYAD